MDPQTDAPAQPAEEPQSSETPAASPPAREPANGLMNRFLRGLGWGRDAEPSADEAAEPAPSEPGAEPAPERPVTPPAAEAPRTFTEDEFRRAVQSAKDRELVQERRRDALGRAEQGDIAPIRSLAERGDAWAKQQLAERGETWALGEIHERELREQAKAAADPLPGIAADFDRSVVWPILAALPLAEEQRIVGPDGIQGMDGRQRAMDEAVKVIQREAAKTAAEAAVTKALADEDFVAQLLKSTAFREALVKVPAANKQFRAYFRGEREEGDIAPAVASSRRRENDFMNDLLRGLPVAGTDTDE